MAFIIVTVFGWKLTMPLRPSARLLAWLLLCCWPAAPVRAPDPRPTALTRPAPNPSSRPIEQRLDQARQLLEEERTEEAEVTLSALQFEQLNIAQQTDYVQLRAELALQRGNGQEALNWLVGDYAYLYDGLPMERQIELRLKRADAYELVGEYLAAARERNLRGATAR